MRAAFGGQGNTAGSAREDESGSAVQPEDEGVQAAADEGVVDGADGEQELTVHLVREAELPQQAEEIHLRDAQLDVPAPQGGVPFEHPGPARLEVRDGAKGEEPRLVDPTGEPR